MANVSKLSSEDVTKTVLDYTFSLSSLKVVKSMSQETLCFEATLNLNEKPFCIVSNRGEGGCNNYSPLKGKQNYREIDSERKRIDLDLRERGPKTKFLGKELTTDLDSVLDNLAQDVLFTKQMYTLMEKRILMFNPSNGKIASVALLKNSGKTVQDVVGTQEKAMVFQETYNKKHGTQVIVLNSLPKEKFLEYIGKHTNTEEAERNIKFELQYQESQKTGRKKTVPSP